VARRLSRVRRCSSGLDGLSSFGCRRRTYAADVSADDARTSGLALAWTAVLAAGVIAWLGAPDIPVTENTGNGCGRWNSAELTRHREELALFLLLPLLVAEGIAAVWIRLRRANLKKFAFLATCGLAWVLLWLWQPANIAYVWSQLLSMIVVAAVVLAILIWFLVAVPRDRELSAPLPPGAVPLLALILPFTFITLVLWTRTPWIWSC
jgi:hypothetical protein